MSQERDVEAVQNDANKVDRQQIDYTAYAASYDQNRHLGRRNAYLEQVRFLAFSRLVSAVPRDAKIVDVGCGTGRGLGYLAQAGYTDLTGLDYTPAMLEVAERNLKDQFPDRTIPLMQGDAFHLPFEDRSFDCLVSFNFLHMFRLDLQDQLIREMARVVRPGGRLIVELESIHKGLFFTRYLEQRRHKATTKYNSILEVGRLFDRQRFDNVRIVGSAFPRLYLIGERAPKLGLAIESLAALPGLKWLASRVVVSGVVR
jgi:ubiquinone/menaquinone biosynthesis C-methylase UbiE